MYKRMVGFNHSRATTLDSLKKDCDKCIANLRASVIVAVSDVLQFDKCCVDLISIAWSSIVLPHDLASMAPHLCPPSPLLPPEASLPPPGAPLLDCDGHTRSSTQPHDKHEAWSFSSAANGFGSLKIILGDGARLTIKVSV